MAYIASLEEGLESVDPDEKKISVPAARCVSKKWIKYEEEQASLLARREVELETTLRDTERGRTLKEGRKKMRKAKEKGFVRDIAARKLEQERRAEWELLAQVQQLAWDREDTMDALGYHELLFLDSLIRNADEEQERNREASARAETVPPDDENGLGDSGDIGAQSPIDTSTMTPAERRRYQKRLHMRKKRAEATGKSVSTETGRLRPGRKTSLPPPLSRLGNGSSSSTRASSRARTPRDSAGEKAEETNTGETTADDSGDSDNDGANGKGKKQGGLTLPQQIRVEFTNLGITFETVQEHGLEIFNLAKFHTLSKIFAESFNRPPFQSIPIHTLELLRAVLDEFLYALMHHTIVLAEEERTMKEHTKVWRGQLNDIKPYHVTDALHLMGMQKYQSKGPLLARLNTALGLEDDGEDAQEQGAPQFAWMPGPPLHSDLYAPLVSHPSLNEADIVDVQDVLLLSDDEDMANVRERTEGMAELALEVAQEAADEKLDQRHEAYLWRLMNGEKRSGESEEKAGATDGSDLGDNESMDEESSGGEDEGDHTMEEDEDEDDIVKDTREDAEVRSRLVHGIASGPNPLRLVAQGGEVKSQPFILNSESDEKDDMTMSE